MLHIAAILPILQRFSNVGVLSSDGQGSTEVHSELEYAMNEAHRLSTKIARLLTPA